LLLILLVPGLRRASWVFSLKPLAICFTALPVLGGAEPRGRHA
jgi:hypothetical protein